MTFISRSARSGSGAGEATEGTTAFSRSSSSCSRTIFPGSAAGTAASRWPPDRSELAQYVLSPFEKRELDAVRALTLRARDAAVVAVAEGLDVAINRFNRTI